MKYSKVVITNLPAFYKINLYNSINKKRKIFVIFTGDDASNRNQDFFKGEIKFDYVNLSEKSSWAKALEVWHILKKYAYDELLIGSWDSLSMWMGAFSSPQKKNALAVESSYYESKTSGIKGWVKKLFLARISKVYASGKAQEKLVKELGFKGETIITKGVGIFNIIPQPFYKQTEVVKNFVYVGRLSPEKNLQFLIDVFNQLPQYTLNIIGFGTQEEELKNIARGNIIFHGVVENHLLSAYYQSNDVFVLPSKSEPWGMVVEEALNNGLPVLVSNKVGCVEEIVEIDRNGLIFDYNNKESLLNVINKISNIDYYNKMKLNISKLNFTSVATYQTNCYLR